MIWLALWLLLFHLLALAYHIPAFRHCEAKRAAGLEIGRLCEKENLLEVLPLHIFLTCGLVWVWWRR